MTTITKTYEKQIAIQKSGWYQKFLEEAKYNYFFLISFTILVGSCWGGIAAMMVLKGGAPIWQLCLNIYTTMASNIASIGQASTKWVINLFVLSVIVNTILIIINSL